MIVGFFNKILTLLKHKLNANEGTNKGSRKSSKGIILNNSEET